MSTIYQSPLLPPDERKRKILEAQERERQMLLEAENLRLLSRGELVAPPVTDQDIQQVNRDAYSRYLQLRKELPSAAPAFSHPLMAPVTNEGRRWETPEQMERRLGLEARAARGEDISGVEQAKEFGNQVFDASGVADIGAAAGRLWRSGVGVVSDLVTPNLDFTGQDSHALTPGMPMAPQTERRTYLREKLTTPINTLEEDIGARAEATKQNVQAGAEKRAMRAELASVDNEVRTPQQEALVIRNMARTAEATPDSELSLAMAGSRSYKDLADQTKEIASGLSEGVFGGDPTVMRQLIEGSFTTLPEVALGTAGIEIAAAKLFTAGKAAARAIETLRKVPSSANRMAAARAFFELSTEYTKQAKVKAQVVGRIGKDPGPLLKFAEETGKQATSGAIPVIAGQNARGQDYSSLQDYIEGGLSEVTEELPVTLGMGVGRATVLRPESSGVLTHSKAKRFADRQLYQAPEGGATPQEAVAAARANTGLLQDAADYGALETVAEEATAPTAPESTRYKLTNRDNIEWRSEAEMPKGYGKDLWESAKNSRMVPQPDGTTVEQRAFIGEGFTEGDVVSLFNPQQMKGVDNVVREEIIHTYQNQLEERAAAGDQAAQVLKARLDAWEKDAWEDTYQLTGRETLPFTGIELAAKAFNEKMFGADRDALKAVHGIEMPTSLAEDLRADMEANAGSVAAAGETVRRHSITPFPNRPLRHQSPHAFASTEKNILGEFDDTKGMSGEGAMIRGAGHYLNEGDAVSQHYRNQFDIEGDLTVDPRMARDLGLTPEQVSVVNRYVKKEGWRFNAKEDFKSKTADDFTPLLLKVADNLASRKAELQAKSDEAKAAYQDRLAGGWPEKDLQPTKDRAAAYDEMVSELTADEDILNKVIYAAMSKPGSVRINAPAKTYEVRPQGAPEDYINQDDLVSDLPPRQYEALRNSLRNEPGSPYFPKTLPERQLSKEDPENSSVAQLLEDNEALSVAEAKDPQDMAKIVASRLAAQGIKGFNFLDALSRDGRGGNTRNWVIFKGEDAEIVERYSMRAFDKNFTQSSSDKALALHFDQLANQANLSMLYPDDEARKIGESLAEDESALYTKGGERYLLTSRNATADPLAILGDGGVQRAYSLRAAGDSYLRANLGEAALSGPRDAFAGTQSDPLAGVVPVTPEDLAAAYAPADLVERYRRFAELGGMAKLTPEQMAKNADPKARKQALTKSKGKTAETYSSRTADQGPANSWARYAETSWAVRSAVVDFVEGRADLDDLLRVTGLVYEGGSVRMTSGATLKSGLRKAASLAKKKTDPKDKYLELVRVLYTGKMLAGNSKADLAVSTSMLNCNPSKMCSTFCYVTTDKQNALSVILKSEILDLAATVNPEGLAELVRDEFLSSRSYQVVKEPDGSVAVRESALRINDTGELSDGWVKVINALGDSKNGAPVRMQVFSKRPELLAQVDPFHLRLLSIDASNAAEMAGKVPEIPRAVVWGGMKDNGILPDPDQVGVLLPVDLGSSYLTKAEVQKLPPKYRRYACPLIADVGPGGKFLQASRGIVGLPTKDGDVPTMGSDAMGGFAVEVEVGLTKDGKETRLQEDAPADRRKKVKRVAWNCVTCDLKGSGFGCFTGRTTDKAFSLLKGAAAKSGFDLTKLDDAGREKMGSVLTQLRDLIDAQGLDAVSRQQLVEDVARLLKGEKRYSLRPAEMADLRTIVGKDPQAAERDLARWLASRYAGDDGDERFMADMQDMWAKPGREGKAAPRGAEPQPLTEEEQAFAEQMAEARAENGTPEPSVFAEPSEPTFAQLKREMQAKAREGVDKNARTIRSVLWSNVMALPGKPSTNVSEALNDLLRREDASKNPLWQGTVTYRGQKMAKWEAVEKWRAEAIEKLKSLSTGYSADGGRLDGGELDTFISDLASAPADAWITEGTKTGTLTWSEDAPRIGKDQQELELDRQMLDQALEVNRLSRHDGEMPEGAMAISRETPGTGVSQSGHPVEWDKDGITVWTPFGRRTESWNARDPFLVKEPAAEPKAPTVAPQPNVPPVTEEVAPSAFGGAVGNLTKAELAQLSELLRTPRVRDMLKRFETSLADKIHAKMNEKARRTAKARAEYLGGDATGEAKASGQDLPTDPEQVPVTSPLVKKKDGAYEPFLTRWDRIFSTLWDEAHPLLKLEALAGRGAPGGVYTRQNAALSRLRGAGSRVSELYATKLLPAYQGGMFGGPGGVKLSKLTPEQIATLEDYAKAKAALGWYKSKTYLGFDEETGEPVLQVQFSDPVLTKARAQQIVDDVENGPDARLMRERQRMLVGFFQELNDVKVESGHWSDDMRNTVQANPDYVPLVGDQFYHGKGEGGGFSGQQKYTSNASLVRRIEGKGDGPRGRSPIPFTPLAKMAYDDARKTFTETAKSEVGRNVVQDIMTLPEDHPVRGMLTEVDEIPKDSKGVPVAGESYLRVRDNGVVKTYRMADELAALVNDAGITKNLGAVYKFFSQLTGFFRSAYTGFNPQFAAANFFRDVQEAMFLTSGNREARRNARKLRDISRLRPSDVLVGMREALKGKKSALRHEALMAGIGMDNGESGMVTPSDQVEEALYGTRRERARNRELFDSKVKQALAQVSVNTKPMLDILAKMGNISETATRLANYRAGSRTSKERALIQARRASIDFQRMGNGIKVWNQVIPFLNAGLQGTEALARKWKTDPIGSTIAYGQLVLTPLVVLSLWNLRDPFYVQINQEEKDKNWILMSGEGDGAYFKVPKSQGAALMATPIDHFVQTVVAKATIGHPTTLRTAKGTAEAMAGRVMPLGSDPSGYNAPFMTLMSQLLDNQNFFGEEIYNEGVPPEMQYSKRTNAALREITPRLPKILPDVMRSPDQAEFVVRGMGGGVADIGLFLMDQVAKRMGAAGDPVRAPEKYPFAKRFIGQVDPDFGAIDKAMMEIRRELSVQSDAEKSFRKSLRGFEGSKEQQRALVEGRVQQKKELLAQLRALEDLKDQIGGSKR